MGLSLCELGRIAVIYNTDYSTVEEISAIYSRIIRNGFKAENILDHAVIIPLRSLSDQRHDNLKKILIRNGLGGPQPRGPALHQKIYREPVFCDAVLGLPLSIFQEYSEVVNGYSAPQYPDT